MVQTQALFCLVLATCALGKKDKKDSSLANTIPPPYSSKTPSPENVSAYGEQGPYLDGWNGQYYPFASYGYGDVIPLGPDVTPYYLAGPYGFYGPYNNGTSSNSTVSELYVGGSQPFNGTSVNGTLYNLTYADGVYTIYKTKGNYFSGSTFEDTEGNGTLNNPEFRVTYNGTFKDPLSSPSTTVINVNLTANGSVLHSANLSSNNSSPAESKSGASRAEWRWAPMAFGVAALLI